MNTKDIEELRNRLTVIERELRTVRSLLEGHAPGDPPKHENADQTSLDDLRYEGDSLKAFLNDPGVSALRDAVDKFFAILGFLHHLHGEKFDRISEIRGRKRVYFSKSKLEIEASGQATMPRQIPHSDWFAVSNHSTVKKAEIVLEACYLLGHSDGECRAAERAINPEATPGFGFGGIPETPDDDDPFKI